MTLGEIIKAFRKEHDMSMDDFSRVSGISKSYISLLEKNKHPKTGKSIAPSVQPIKQAAPHSRGHACRGGNASGNHYAKSGARKQSGNEGSLYACDRPDEGPRPGTSSGCHDIMISSFLLPICYPEHSGR